jgi:hypothetical protein
MRAFRPSRYGRQEEAEQDSDRAKQANLQRYVQRAQAGLPLFEKASNSGGSKSVSTRLMFKA